MATGNAVRGIAVGDSGVMADLNGDGGRVAGDGGEGGYEFLTIVKP